MGLVMVMLALPAGVRGQCVGNGVNSVNCKFFLLWVD